MIRLEEFSICKIVRRLNRFLVEVFIDGKLKKASINNTGRLTQYLIRGMDGICMTSGKNLKLIGVIEGERGIILDTRIHERSFEVSIEKGFIKWLRGYKIAKKNIRIGGSVIDYLLEKRGERILLELKSAVFRNGNIAMYPDTRSRRAERQVVDLLEFEGKKGILFVSAIPNANGFRFNNLRAPRLYEILLKNKEKLFLKSIGLYFDVNEQVVVLYNDDLPVSLKRLSFGYLDLVEEAIEEYNSIRAPESIAQLWEFNDRWFKVRFTGHFCYTCGFYDYFDDFLFILKDMGEEFVIEEVTEIPGGAVVKFSKPPRSSYLSQG